MATPLDEERARLREAGYAEDEISRYFVERLRGEGQAPAAGGAAPQGNMSGVLGNANAVLSHVKATIPVVTSATANLSNPGASPKSRFTSAAVLLGIGFVVCVLGFAIYQEWQQHIVYETEIKRLNTQISKVNVELTTAQNQKAQAEAAVAREVASGQVAQAEKAKAEAEVAKQVAAGQVAQAEKAKAEAAVAREVAAGQVAQAEKAKADAEVAREVAAGQVAQAEKARAEADVAKQVAAGQVAQAEKAKAEAAVAKQMSEAQAKKLQAEADAAKALNEAQVKKIQAEANAAKALNDAQVKKLEAEAAVAKQVNEAQAQKLKADAAVADEVAAGAKAKSCSERMELLTKNMIPDDFDMSGNFVTVKPGTASARMMEKYNRECGGIVGSGSEETQAAAGKTLDKIVSLYGSLVKVTLESKQPSDKFKIDEKDAALQAACLIGVRLAAGLQTTDENEAGRKVMDSLQECARSSLVYVLMKVAPTVFAERHDPSTAPDQSTREYWSSQNIAHDIQDCTATRSDFPSFVACSCRAGAKLGAAKVLSNGDLSAKQSLTEKAGAVCEAVAPKIAESDSAAAAKYRAFLAAPAPKPTAPTPTPTATAVAKPPSLVATPTPTPTPSYAAIATPTPTPAPTVPKRAPTALKNYDLEGNDLEHFPSDSFDSCLSACSNNSQCQGVTFDKWNKVCFLKGAVTLLWFNAHGVSAYIDPTAKLRFSDAPVYMLHVAGRGFPKTTNTTYADNAAACEETCRTTSWCAADTFFRSSHQCSMLGTADEYFPNSDADAGVKRQKNY